MTELSRSARRFQEILGEGFDVVELPASTRTATEAADAVGASVAQIVKSLVFRDAATNEPVLVLASGPNRVNEALVGELLGATIEKADAAYVREQTGYSIGGVPPVGHARAITTIVDEDLAGMDEVWAAAGTPNAVFKLAGAQLVALTNGRVTRIG